MKNTTNTSFPNFTAEALKSPTTTPQRLHKDKRPLGWVKASDSKWSLSDQKVLCIQTNSFQHSCYLPHHTELSLSPPVPSFT